MKIDNDKLLDPDYFAAELHTCLLMDGIRSPSIRRLRRVAWGKPELERIFEIKVSEFQRYEREARQPTLSNLPIRAFEWVWENAKFTPARDVGWTILAIILTISTVELSKFLLDKYKPIELDKYQTKETALLSDEKGEELVRQVDRWLAGKLANVLSSDQIESSLQKVLHDRISSGDLLADYVDRRVKNPEFAAELAHLIMEQLSADELNGSSGENVDQGAMQAQFQLALEARLSSPEFQESLGQLLLPQRD